jgi:hypothetical protein
MLIIDEWREQMSVRPLRGDMHINQKLSLGRTPSGAFEGGIDVLLSTVVM